MRIVCRPLRLEPFFDYDLIASLTPGYVGADLLALATRAGLLAVTRLIQKKQENALMGSANSSSSVSDLMLEDGLIMQIDIDLSQKNDDEEVASSPNIIEPMDISSLSKEQENQNAEAKDAEASASTAPGDNTTEQNTKEATTTTSELPTNSEDTNKPTEVKNDETSKNTEEKAPESAAENNPETNAEAAKSDDANPDAPVPVDFSTNETLGGALLKNDEIKHRMGLETMFKWLSDNNTLVTKKDMINLYITAENFKEAIKLVQPSAKREGFITVPDVTWNDIGSLRDIREELNLAILAPVKFPNRLKQLGITAPSGVLLCGPPGKNNFITNV